MNTDTTTARIAALNDEARRNSTDGSMFLITCGIKALPAADQEAIVGRVFAFADFTPENDPHGEHDFGAFDHNGQRIFWKVDCYDRDMRHGSEDPSDPQQTRRVLTVMLAEEY